jgi:hypothetical protein
VVDGVTVVDDVGPASFVTVWNGVIEAVVLTDGDAAYFFGVQWGENLSGATTLDLTSSTNDAVLEVSNGSSSDYNVVVGSWPNSFGSNSEPNPYVAGFAGVAAGTLAFTDYPSDRTATGEGPVSGALDLALSWQDNAHTAHSATAKLTFDTELEPDPL